MKIKILTILIFVLLSPVVYSDYYPQDEYRVRSYEDARLARVNYSIGETYVERSYEQGLEEAVNNLPVFNQDRIGTTDGRLELYMGRFNYLRLDYDSEILFDKAPRIRTTRTGIRINRGGVYLMVNQLDSRRDIQIQTPDCGIFLLENGRYRINVHEGGGTEILVYRGLADVSGEHRGFNIRSTFTMTMYAGDAYRMPTLFRRYSQDDFEMWNMERNRLLNRSIRYRSRYLDPTYAYYEHELSGLGRWLYDGSYRTHIWIPHNAGASWRPYSRGRWIYHPHYGYVWNSYDSWGWYTHHYGRWHWSQTYGWYWIPGSKWSPAWVSWSWTDNYYSWCPLSIRNRPVIVVRNKWLRNYRYQSGFPFDSSSVIVIRKDNLWSRRIHKRALSRNAVMKMRSARINFRGRHPRLVPKTNRVSVINAKGKTVIYKKKGFLSPEKYQNRKSAAQARKQNVNRYSGLKKRIRAEKKTEAKYRVLRKSNPVYKSFSKRPEKTPNRDVHMNKDGTKRNVEQKKRKTVTQQSPDKMRRKTQQTTTGKTTSENKGYKTLQKGGRKKVESPDKKKQKKTTKEKKKKEKKKKDKTKKKKDENKRN